jgi:hypothetical protein
MRSRWEEELAKGCAAGSTRESLEAAEGVDTGVRRAIRWGFRDLSAREFDFFLDNISGPRLRYGTRARAAHGQRGSVVRRKNS